jgi:hypothetical protein
MSNFDIISRFAALDVGVRAFILSCGSSGLIFACCHAMKHEF